MIYLHNVNNQLSSLLGRIDHGVPAAAMNAHNTQDQTKLTNATMTNCSTSPVDEQYVQHGSSTWLEQPSVVTLPVLPGFTCLDQVDGFVPVNSMRRFCPVSLARVDPPPAHDFALDASGNRYAALQEMEDVVALQSDQDRVTEDDSKEDQDPRGGDGAPSSPKNNRMGPNRKGSSDLMESNPDNCTSNHKYNKNKNRNKSSTSGWRQKVLPYGHANPPTTINMMKTRLSNKLCKIWPAIAAGQLQATGNAGDVEVSGAEGVLKPPPPVRDPERKCDSPTCSMYGELATGGV